jgi:DNA repair ATPase RecN
VSGGEWGALLAGLGTLVGTVYVGARGWRSDKTTAAETQEANLLSGYGGLMEELRSEIRRLREDHEAERKTWTGERARLFQEIDRLRARVQELEKRTPPHGTPATP